MKKPNNQIYPKLSQPWVENLAYSLHWSLQPGSKQCFREKEVTWRRAGRIPEAGLGSASQSCPIRVPERSSLRTLQGGIITWLGKHLSPRTPLSILTHELHVQCHPQTQTSTSLTAARRMNLSTMPSSPHLSQAPPPRHRR